MTSPEFEQWLRLPPAARRPLVMGILNVTPDSFSDGGRFSDVTAAVFHARDMAHGGADIVDVGGESTRPGAGPVSSEEQIRRIEPVIHALHTLGITVSIDTTLSAVADVAVRAGVALVNDVSGGLADPGMLPFAARAGVPICLMHARGTPATMQSLAVYDDVVAEVREHLRARRDAALAAGVAPHRVILDPGIGFAKTHAHDLRLLRRLSDLTDLACPLLVGTSRKKFIGAITGEAEPHDRLFGTAATVAWAVANGAAIVRVHDVAAMAKVVRVVRAIAEA